MSVPKIGERVRVRFDSGSCKVEGKLLELNGSWVNLEFPGGKIGGNVKDVERDVEIIKEAEHGLVA